MGHSFNCFVRLSCGLFLLTCILFSCQDDRKKNKEDDVAVAKGSLTITSDSFDIADLQLNPSIQEGIVIDTIELDSKKHHVWTTIAIPQISRKAYPAAAKFIDSIARLTRSEFYEDTKDEGFDAADSIPEDQGWYYWTHLLSYNKSDKLISIAFENGGGYSGMPSGYEYNTFNYDIEKKKRLYFGDYFKMETASDTLFWADIISRAVTTEMNDKRKFFEWHGEMSFASDEDNIYFFFDRFDIYAGGMIGAVKKKYVIDHIREEYR